MPEEKRDELEPEAGCSPPLQWRPMPADLHSVYEEGPFSKCTVCSVSLNSGSLYEIQKVFRGHEVVFEMALCQGCGDAICQEFSKESMEAVKGFLLCNFTPNLESVHCHFCGIPRALLERYTLVGACREHSIILPMIILCDKCGEALQTQISPKTRETQEEFVRDNFPGIPGTLDLNPSIGGLFA